MAIDDNTSYELTGAQVKDLASKIKAKADSSSLATVATSGNYNDLTNQPTIPTVNDATLTIQQNGSTVGTFTANASSNTTISLTDTTYSAMTGATSGAAGTSGLVPAPAAGDESKVLSGAGTWVNQSGGGASTVIYYANSTSTAGFQSGTINGPYIYKDAARTTIATPGEIYNNFQAGNPIRIEYESTQTGTSAFAMTLEVATMSLNGSGTYSMVVNEVNEETPNDSRDLVMLRLYTNWDGQSTFSSRWFLQRKYVHNGTLTIQQNGTTVGTFTANQSANTTINLAGGIYADDPTASANPDGWITPNDIDWSTFTYSASEQRVGTWVNGKPVYKKTIDTGTMPNNTRKQVAHNISNLDFIISMGGAAYGNNTFVPIPYADTSGPGSLGMFMDRNNIIIFSGSNASYLTTSYVTIYYTKTTD